MANIMDTIMKANQKEREKNEKADKKLKAEHDDLLSRRVVLENSEVKLEDDIEKVSQRIRDSENRRDKDTEEEIARVREKCLKQHESRMKQIQKSTGCDYDATRKKLQKIRDEIASNGAQSIKLEQQAKHREGIYEAEEEPVPEIKSAPEERNDDSTSTTHDPSKDAEPVPPRLSLRFKRED